MYAPVDGQWRLFGISVSVGQSAPVAPEPAAVAPSSRQVPPSSRAGKVAPRPSYAAGKQPPVPAKVAAAQLPNVARRSLKSMKVMFATPCYISAVR